MSLNIFRKFKKPYISEFKDEEEQVFERCDFCGGPDNIINLKTVPDRFGHYNFCREGSCVTSYHNYIYSKDLTNGIPYAIKTTYPQDLRSGPRQCAYCGKRNENVIRVFSAPRFLRYKSFCKNDKCYKTFYHYVIAKPPSPPFKDPFNSPEYPDSDESNVDM
jgi:hypothetical protein